MRASIAQRLLVLFWHRVERLQQQPRSSRSGRIDGRPSRPSSNGSKWLGVAQPFWCVGSGSGSCCRRPHRRGGAETLKEPLITWDGCRLLDTRSHDDHWTKCRHPETAHNTVSSYDCTVRCPYLSKPENVRAAPYAQIFARQCAGLQIRPHSTLGRERFFKAGPRASGSKPPMLLCMGLQICLDENLYGFLAGVYLHSDRCVAKIYLMATTVLASNNSVRHFPPLRRLRSVDSHEPRSAPGRKIAVITRR